MIFTICFPVIRKNIQYICCAINTEQYIFRNYFRDLKSLVPAHQKLTHTINIKKPHRVSRQLMLVQGAGLILNRHRVARKFGHPGLVENMPIVQRRVFHVAILNPLGIGCNCSERRKIKNRGWSPSRTAAQRGTISLAHRQPPSRTAA